MEVGTMAAIIADVTSVFTAAIGWVGDVATTIGSTPILLIFTIIPLVGLGVGLFKRLINVN
jgi:hypothetical protein